jgi:hypothetical protein
LLKLKTNAHLFSYTEFHESEAWKLLSYAVLLGVSQEAAAKMLAKAAII